MPPWYSSRYRIPLSVSAGILRIIRAILWMLAIPVSVVYMMLALYVLITPSQEEILNALEDGSASIEVDIGSIEITEVIPTRP